MNGTEGRPAIVYLLPAVLLMAAAWFLIRWVRGLQRKSTGEDLEEKQAAIFKAVACNLIPLPVEADNWRGCPEVVSYILSRAEQLEEAMAENPGVKNVEVTALHHVFSIVRQMLLSPIGVKGGFKLDPVPTPTETEFRLVKGVMHDRSWELTRSKQPGSDRWTWEITPRPIGPYVEQLLSEPLLSGATVCRVRTDSNIVVYGYFDKTFMAGDELRDATGIGTLAKNQVALARLPHRPLSEDERSALIKHGAIDDQKAGRGIIEMRKYERQAAGGRRRRHQ